MTRSRSTITVACVTGLLLLAACSSSAKVGTPSGTTIAVDINTRQIALVRAATGDLLHACARRAIAEVKHHVTAPVRDQDWEHTCAAVAAHHMRLGTVAVAVHGTSATAHVRMTTDHGNLAGDLRWHRDHDGWHMSQVPSILTGGWDHDAHHWLTKAGHVEADDHPSSSVGHHDDDHSSSSVPAHHDGDHTSTSAVHHDGDHTSTSAVHHDDDHTSTSAVHHDDDHTSTSAVHHDDQDH